MLQQPDKSRPYWQSRAPGPPPPRPPVPPPPRLAAAPPHSRCHTGAGAKTCSSEGGISSVPTEGGEWAANCCLKSKVLTFKPTMHWTMAHAIHRCLEWSLVNVWHGRARLLVCIYRQFYAEHFLLACARGGNRIARFPPGMCLVPATPQTPSPAKL